MGQRERVVQFLLGRRGDPRAFVRLATQTREVSLQLRDTLLSPVQRKRQFRGAGGLPTYLRPIPCAGVSQRLRRLLDPSMLGRELRTQTVAFRRNLRKGKWQTALKAARR